MSLNQIMSTAVSGMSVAQTNLRAISDNIANVNTPGYARKVVDQGSLVSGGMGVGVDVQRVRAVADRFLQAAGRTAGAGAAGAAASADLFDRAQALFGDPSEGAGFFSSLDQLFAAFSSAGADPASSVLRSGATDAASDFLAQAHRIGSSLSDLRHEADSRIADDIDEVNRLVVQIDSLNGDIRRAQAQGADSAGSEGLQNGLIDQLSTLMDIRVAAKPGGGVVVRTNDGVSLAGDGAGVLSFSVSTDGSGQIGVTPFGASLTQPLPLSVNAGEIRGLLDMRSRELPALSQQLSEFVSGAVEALNTAHNAHASVPAPSTMTGRNTGLDLPTAVSGFSGKTSIALLGADSSLAHKIDIDFTAGTMSLDGGAATAFTPATFLAQLNGKLGADGTASFTNGRLSLAANGGLGLAIVDDAAAPSQKTGRGFSTFFGMNDLISANTFVNYDTGLKPADNSGFLAGGQITVRITNASGDRIRDIPITLPGGGTMQNLLDTLNADGSGVGLYGAFSLDANGEMSFSPDRPGQVNFSIVGDNTQRGVGGPSISALFGLGADQRGQRTSSFEVRADIAASPSRLAFANVNLAGAALGDKVTAAGDSAGALALADAGGRTRAFSAAGDLGAMQVSITQYGAQLSGLIGRKAAQADSTKTTAQAVASEAAAQRSSVEGVNLDEELVALTTFQQAFNASARLIQATKDMYDALLGLMM